MPSLLTRRHRRDQAAHRDESVELGRPQPAMPGTSSAAAAEDGSMTDLIVGNPAVPVLMLLVAQFAIVFLWEFGFVLKAVLSAGNLAALLYIGKAVTTGTFARAAA